MISIGKKDFASGFSETTITVMLCFAVFIFVLKGSNVDAADRVLSISTGEWPPYVSQNIEGGGMTQEIVRAACVAAGLQTAFTYFPWKRALLTMKSGKVEASFPWVKRADRQEFAWYSNPLHKRTILLFYSRQRFPQGIQDYTVAGLKAYRIGVPRGYALVRQYRDMGLQVVVVDTSEQGMLKLCRGHIDLMSESRIVGTQILKKKFPKIISEFAAIPAPVDSEELYMLFSKNVNGIRVCLDRFNEGLSEIKKNGIFDQIVRKYFGDK